MNEDLPYWIKVVASLGPLFAATATLFVGVIVATIAYRQWRTAHDKVVLDLFDRRMKIHEAFREIMTDYLSRDGNLVGSQIRFRLQRLWSEARFLFGKEVPDFIRKINLSTAERETLMRTLDQAPEHDQKALMEKHYAIERELINASMNFSVLLHPYMLMDQKRR